MRKTFLSGLAVVIPFAITIWALLAIFGGIDAIINDTLFQLTGFSITGLGLIIALVATFIIGGLTRTKLGTWFYNIVNRIVYKVPFISKVYKLAKETMEVITSERAFKTVVKVEFPRAGVYSIGFLTNENTIFIPTTPNPTSGFLIQTNKYEIVDMTVENALRYIVSMGTIR
jgi:uncharacterized membrane protein